MHDLVMPGLVPVHMKVAQMHGPAAGERSMHVVQIGDLVVVQPQFPMGEEPKKPIEWFAEAVSDICADSIGPRGDASDHCITRSSSARS